MQHLSSPQIPFPQILHEITQFTLTLSIFHPSPSVPFYSRCCCVYRPVDQLGCVLSRPSALRCWSVSAPPAGSEWLCPGPAPKVPGSCCPLSLGTPRGLRLPPPRSAFSLDPLHSASSGQSVEQQAIPTPQRPCPLQGQRSVSGGHCEQGASELGQGAAGALPRGPW